MRFAFVDLETTGMGAARDAITEIGIVRVDCEGDDAHVTEWSSLVHPGQPIPPAIQALTGITDAMVRDAPPFSAVAARVLALLEDAVLVAHNARFDYAFLKHAFARLGEKFSARVLCTVRLSRRLFPQAESHSLDAVIARHGLTCLARHRALGDARAVWSFMRTLRATVASDVLDAAIRRVLRTPSLPAHLPPDILERLPEAPGVYMFYGLNALPLYIGKSRNLRERVAAHFSSDYRSSTDLRLSSEVQRIEHEETAGEIGALLREAALVKAMLPAHNHALRRKAASGLLELPAAPAPPRYIAAPMLEPRELAGRYGPFSSRQQARATLQALAREHRLCWTALGLERRVGPCFARQVARCAGACVGAESAAAHHARVAAALAPWRVPHWPFAGMAVLYERAEFGERTDVHVVRDWCWLGTARDESELGALVEAPPRPEFDIDIARLLIRTLARKRVPVHAVPTPPKSAFACEFDHHDSDAAMTDA
jgi:DNA polymerase-3 subunit epsilon